MKKKVCNEADMLVRITAVVPRPAFWMERKASISRYRPELEGKSKARSYKCCVYMCLECEERYVYCDCDYQCSYLTDSELRVARAIPQHHPQPSVPIEMS